MGPRDADAISGDSECSCGSRGFLAGRRSPSEIGHGRAPHPRRDQGHVDGVVGGERHWRPPRRRRGRRHDIAYPIWYLAFLCLLLLLLLTHHSLECCCCWSAAAAAASTGRSRTQERTGTLSAEPRIFITPPVQSRRPSCSRRSSPAPSTTGNVSDEWKRGESLYKSRRVPQSIRVRYQRRQQHLLHHGHQHHQQAQHRRRLRSAG